MARRLIWDAVSLIILGAGLHQIIWWLGAAAELAP